jgi:transcriptional regulator with XRE-family HTH domain
MQCSGQGGYVETLREFRRRRGWSQKDLADESGVGQDTISGIESGRHEPRPSTLRKLADALDVEVADFFREPALPLAEAPREARPPQTSTQSVEEFEQTLESVLEPVRAEALREQRAASRAIASEGIPQVSIGDIAEEEVGRRFQDAFSPDERPTAFGELALGYARLERANVNLEANFKRAQGLIRERDEKIAQMKEGDVRLREENARLRQDIAELRSEAERETTR